MKIFSYLLVISLAVFSGCESDDPQYPTTPFIEFVDLVFVKSNSEDPWQSQSELQLTLSYRDGDSDLGLDFNNPDHRDFPYQFINFFLESDGQLVPVGTEKRYPDLPFSFLKVENHIGKIATIRSRQKPEYDLLPPFTPSSCFYLYDTTIAVSAENIDIVDTSYNIRDTLHSNFGYPDVFLVKDTFYIARNENYTNIAVDILVAQADGAFEVVDLGGCDPPYYGRFPDISLLPKRVNEIGPFLIEVKNKWEGNITFSLRSVGFITVFKDKIIKLRVRIKDRALNTSNVIETPPATLESIQQ